MLVNNSGLAVPETVAAITDEGWDKVLETNLRGVMQMVRAVLPYMKQNDFGDIVNISSQAGKHGYADVPSYCASKFGLLGYAEALRDDVRKTGANIRVFNFLPWTGGRRETLGRIRAARWFYPCRQHGAHTDVALSLDRSVVLEDVNIYGRYRCLQRVAPSRTYPGLSRPIR